MNKKTRGKFTLIDLFAGCGGLSLGFEKAGFEVLLGTDNWEEALKTFAHNHDRAKALNEDIRKLTGKKIREYVGGKEIDLVVGGPPCQGFSLAGNRKEDDDRNNLIYEFVRIVKEINPKIFVMENVLGILSMRSNGRLVKDILVEKFKKIGYENITIGDLYAHYYGVPQTRRRAVFIGNKLGIDFKFPVATHGEGKKPFVTVGDAISDLPTLDDTFGEEVSDYNLRPKSEYQEKIRKRSKSLYNHTKSNHSNQTTRVISFVPEGGNWRDLPKRFQNIRSYSNTWRRLDSKKPSVTIDTGHRHHFHYKANRVPTVRESARIQSFPDDFVFLGSRTSQFRQVGNAVPPYFAGAIAKQIKLYLDHYYGNR